MSAPWTPAQLGPNRRTRRPRKTIPAWTVGLVLGILLGAALLVAVPLVTHDLSKAHRSEVATDTIHVGPPVGSGCSTSCSVTTLKTAAYSAVLAFITEGSTTVPTTPTSAVGTFALVNSETGGGSGEWVYLANNVSASAAATVTAPALTNPSTFITVDVQNVTTSALDASGVATGSSTVSASCVTTVSNDAVFLGVSKTGTVTASGVWSGTGGSLLLSEASASGTTYNKGAALYQADASTGSFVISAASTSSSVGVGVCVALKAALVPVAPASVSVGTVTTTTVPLTWTNRHGPVLNSTVYVAPYSGGSCGAYSVHHSVGSAQARAYTIAGLTSGQHICVKVTDWNSTGQSAFSTVLSNVVTAHIPPAPSAVLVAAVYGSTTDLGVSWVQPLGTVTDNHVYYGTTAACGGIQAALDVGVETHADLGSLAPSTAFYVQVTASNATGESAESACASGTTNAVVGHPTALHASGITPTTATITWSQPSGSVANDTLLYGASCGVWTRVSEGSVSTAALGSLNPLTTYCVTVQAWSAGVSGAYAHPYLNFTTTNAPPSRPTLLTAVAVGRTYADLTWTQGVPSSGSIVNNTVFYGTACGTWGGKLSTAGAAVAFNLSVLNPSSTYCVAVSAWTLGGPSHLDYTNVTTLAGLPSAPTALTLVVSGLHGFTFRFTNPVASLVNDTVRYGTVAGCGAPLTHVSTGGPTTSWSLGGLTPYTSYFVSVAAWTSGGPSVYSACAVFITQDSTPPAPVLGIPTVGDTWVVVTWTNAPHYVLTNDTIYYGPTCGSTYFDWLHVTSTGSARTSFNVTGLAEGSPVCFAVTAWADQSNLSHPFLNVTTLHHGGGGGGGGASISAFAFLGLISLGILTVAFLAAIFLYPRFKRGD